MFPGDLRDEVKREKKGLKGIEEVIDQEWSELNQAARDGKLGRGVTIRIR